MILSDNKLNKFEVGRELITLWFDLLIEVILVLEKKLLSSLR